MFIQAEKIAKLVKAANVNVESYWPGLFAKLCQKKNIDELIMNVGASGDAVGAAATVATNVPAAAQALPAAEETKKKKVRIYIYCLLIRTQLQLLNTNLIGWNCFCDL